MESVIDKRRIAIYSFYDIDGIVDKYVEFFLDDFSKSIERLLIVCNCVLDEENKEKLLKYTEEVITRENKGFDIWGYKTGMETIGFDELALYDEVVIANNTIMGPVSSLSLMFEEMAQRSVDFWGITRHYAFTEGDPFGCNEYGYIPEHIQSYFMVFRKRMVSSKEFQEYWENLPMLHDYNEAVGIHETAFTKKFADIGYTWDSYVDTEDIKDLSLFPLMDYPTLLIRDKKCPIFKKRAFFQDYNNLTLGTVGQQTVELYEYIRDYTDYEVDYIWDTILRTCHQSDIYKCLQLNYILSSEEINDISLYENVKKQNTALFMHLFFDDLAEQSLKYASSVPDFVDIYITTDTEHKKKVFEDAFKALKNKVVVLKVPNRGRDVSSLLVSLADVLPQYDIGCFYHDKKSGQNKPGSVGESFGYKCAENVLHNEHFVWRVLKTFLDNPRLGLLSPPEPNHAEYFASLGHEWFNNYANTKELADKLGINVPMSEDKEPVAPLGSVFWFRIKALEPLHNHQWKYEDFPEEPLPIDNTISHAIERIRPYAAQSAGYYPALVMVDTYARIEYTNLRQYLRNYVKFLERHDFLIGKQSDIIRLMDQTYNKPGIEKNSGSKLSPSMIAKMENIGKKVFPKSVYDNLIKVKRKLFGPHI